MDSERTKSLKKGEVAACKYTEVSGLKFGILFSFPKGDSRWSFSHAFTVLTVALFNFFSEPTGWKLVKFLTVLLRGHNFRLLPFYARSMPWGMAISKLETVFFSFFGNFWPVRLFLKIFRRVGLKFHPDVTQNTTCQNLLN